MATITVGFSPLKPSIFFASSSHHKQSPTTLFYKPPFCSSFIASNRITSSFTPSPSFSSSTILYSSRWRPSSATSESLEPEAVESELVSEPTQIIEADEVQETAIELAQLALKDEIPKGAEVFAVVMVGSRQYIVIPGRSIYTQRLKDADVNDKIILNKVLLVGTKTDTYVGKPVVPNAAVHAVVEEQGLNKKVVVFKYKKRKNYRRNIGHRQPNTRIRITGITGYEDSPAPVPAASVVA